MLGSEFAALFKDKGRVAWEAAALSLAQQGDSIVRWPMVNLTLSTPPDKSSAGHTAILPVASDVFAIGTPENYLRLPLTPGAAQSIANLGGYLLPTTKIAQEIQRAAARQGVQLVPSPITNRAPQHLMEDYVRHDAIVQKQLAAKSASFGTLVAGHKKDVVIGNIYKPHRVLIYGWFWPDGMTPPMMNTTQRFSQPIQGYSNIHDDIWVDYSHGIRLVSPVMMVDGAEKKTDDVLQDPELSKLLSAEGPLRMLRYPSPIEPVVPRPASKSDYVTVNDVFYRPNTTSLADQGLAVMLENERRRP